MAKRLYMTSADYLAIAISPALVMALVGSLVFFLIEVLYVGEYQARLTYAFGLFVFAAVLIARISIEMGSERAALFALALGVVMFLFLLRFVEHPNAFSPLINLALMALVWWCADRLTWDSTVIDDDQDSSGEGLMQRMGVDGPAAADTAEPAKEKTARGQVNELYAANSEDAGDTPPTKRWWRRLISVQTGPHTPGLWVLYFSLAALPLFGIGQHWIPAADVGRRRYVFFLLVVYVAAALALLVTTSFLGLRRYLRQRRVEMPVPIAATWVGLGAALIGIVMLLAALIPRPAAEIALSRVPWQVGSPGGMAASRTAVNRDGGEKAGETESATPGEAIDEEGQAGDLRREGEKASDDAAGDEASGEVAQGESQAHEGDRSREKRQAEGGENQSESDAASEQGMEEASAESDQAGGSDDQRESEAGKSGESGEPQSDGSGELETETPEAEGQPSGDRTPTQSTTPATPESPSASEALQSVSSSLGGIAGLLKILFYIVVAIALAYFAWKYRHQLIQALADIWLQLRELLGGKQAAETAAAEAASASGPRPRSFAEFRDPFADGQYGRISPEELVRYTFAAFEAWANDHGCPRTLDCTPQELVRAAVDPRSPMHGGAQRLVRLYGELAYASRRISRESTDELRGLWQMMRSAPPADATLAEARGR